MRGSPGRLRQQWSLGRDAISTNRLVIRTVVGVVGLLSRYGIIRTSAIITSRRCGRDKVISDGSTTSRSLCWEITIVGRSVRCRSLGGDAIIGTCGATVRSARGLIIGTIVGVIGVIGVAWTLSRYGIRNTSRTISSRSLRRDVVIADGSTGSRVFCGEIFCVGRSVIRWSLRGDIVSTGGLAIQSVRGLVIRTVVGVVGLLSRSGIVFIAHLVTSRRLGR
jgi:hypothetical protein